MILQNEIVSVIISLFVQKCLAQYPNVRCPDVFQYERPPGVREVIGRVSVDQVKFGETRLQIILSQPEEPDLDFESLDFKGNITLEVDENDINKYIESGFKLLYKVLFPIPFVIPTVHSIRVNNDRICTGPKIPTGNRKFILAHTMNIPAQIKPPTTELPVYLEPSSPRSDADVQQNSTTGWKYIDSICGQENLNDTHDSYIVNGAAISGSRFPWIVSIFQKNQTLQSIKCGGSLISTRTVVSAARCFFSGSKMLKKEDFLISLGRNKLTDLSDSHVFNSDVETIIPHPDFNNPQLNINDANLAIVWLEKTVTFSLAIRPVCLWQGPWNADNIDGVSGIVVVWDKEKYNDDILASPRPTILTATIVSWSDCVTSNPEFIYITSDQTLCAGNSYSETVPCDGDSGSGLMIRNRNKWMLRGTVSQAHPGKNHQCNPSQHVVYADIAYFMDWIKENTLL